MWDRFEWVGRKLVLGPSREMRSMLGTEWIDT
jgi:hypothetical protein